MEKLRSVVLLLIMYCLSCGNAVASGGVKCSDWINANINTNNAITSTGYLLDGSGGVGGGNVSAVCRDVSWVIGGRFTPGAIMGFPNLSTRVKLVRQGSDAFTSRYTLSNQLCSHRDISNKFECSVSFLKCTGKWYNPATWHCTWAVYGDAWGNTNNSNPQPMYTDDGSVITSQTVSFGSKSNNFINGGFGGNTNNYCLRRYTDGDTMRHGGTYKGSQDYICAYANGGCDISRSICYQSPLADNPPACWTNDLVGCVHELPRPGPPIYNQALVQAPSPYVDQNNGGIYAACSNISDATLKNTCVLQNYYVQTYASKFHQPVITLLRSAYGVQGGDDYVPAATLSLRYVYPGDAPIDSLPNCGEIAGITYCAVAMSDQYPTVPSSQICACVEEYCARGSYLGCVPRPNLKQSGYALVVDHVPVVDDNSSFYTTSTATQVNPIPHATVHFVQTDNIGPLIYDASNARVKKWLADRKYYKVDASGNFRMNGAAIDASYIAQYPVYYGPSLSPTFTSGAGDAVTSMGEYTTNYVQSSTNGNPPNPSSYSIDGMHAYGASISAIMPQMSATSSQPISASVYSTPAIYTSSAPSVMSLYSAATVNASSTGPEGYYVPDGSRYRVACNGIHGPTGAALCTGDCVQCNYNNGVASYFQDYSTPPAAISSAYCQNDASGAMLTPSSAPALQCCSGQISYYATQAYADGVVCQGAYVSDYAERNAGYIMGRDNISAVSGGLASLYATSKSLPNGSTAPTNVSNSNAMLGSPIYQAQNICVYATDWDFIGYNLNSSTAEYDDPTGLNTYLCDHIPQRCELINLTASTPPANVYMPIENIASPGTVSVDTGYASWPTTEYNPTTGVLGTTATGTCASGYATASGGSTTTRTCVDGVWNGVSTGNMCLAKCVIPTSGNTSSVGNGANFSGTLGSASAPFIVSGSTVTATACASGYKQTVSNAWPRVTCTNGVFTNVVNACNTYCSVTSGSAASGYGTGFSPILGTSSPYISSGTSATATGCAAGYNKNGSSWPVVTCNGATGALSIANGCNASCNIVNGAQNVGYGTYSSTTINGTVTATGCATGYVSTTGVMPSVTCNGGVLSAPTNPCVAGCSAFTAPIGTIFSDTNAKANGSTLSGTCDTANGYYGSCAIVSPNAGIGTWSVGNTNFYIYPGATNNSTCQTSAATSNNTVTYKCQNGAWTMQSNPCGNKTCAAFQGHHQNWCQDNNHADSTSGWTGKCPCDSSHKGGEHTYYCMNGTWSFVAASPTDYEGCG